MIQCPKCNSTSWKQLYRSVTDPAEDEFQCVACNHKFKRYNSPAPPIKDQYLAKWGERYGLSVDDVKGLGVLLRAYKRQQERVCNGDPFIGIDPADKNACSAAWEKQSEESARVLVKIVKKLGFDGIDFGVGLYPALIKGSDSCIMVPQKD